MHAIIHLKALKGIKTTRDNLQEAIGGRPMSLTASIPA